MYDPQTFRLLTTGHKVIDEQHAQIYKLVDSLANLAEEMGETKEIADFIYGILRYVLTHFKAEEALMAECGYPGLDRQQAAHVKFADDVRAMADSYRTSSSPSARELYEFMHVWIREHIEAEDMQLAEFIRASGCEPADDQPEPAVPPYYPLS